MAAEKIFFASPDIKSELLDSGIFSPETSDCRLIKSNPVRDVRYFEKGFFVKTDRRGSSFKKEYNTGLLLQNSGIPVVEHLAYGTTAAGSILVTRAAAAGCVDMLNYVSGKALSPQALHNFTGFLLKFKESPFFHSDFHLGNILFHPETNSFMLVDVHAVRRKLVWEKFYTPFCVYKPLFSLREQLSNSQMLELLNFIGTDNAEKLYIRGMQKEAAMILKQWQKRKKQFDDNYNKFIRCENGMRIYQDAPADFRDRAEIISTSDGAKLFTVSHFLRLASIAHCKIWAYDPASETIFAEKLPTSCQFANADDAADMMWRASLYNLPTDAGQWMSDGTNRTFLKELTALNFTL